jgi:ATP-dependent helicase/DNAse subunit B
VDYKTGNEVFDERKIRFGLSLQLPIYSLLLDEYYQDYDQMGIFIQSVIPSEEDYRLNGIMKKDISKIKIFDQEFGLPTYSSKYFAGAKINKDGEFISSKALLEEEAWNKVILESKEQVINTISKIRQGEFTISPIVMVDENNSSPCLYCSHRSICFKEKSDQREERKGV